MSIPFDDEVVAAHVDHCCVIHGCKYGDDFPGRDGCPVVERIAFQAEVCESCRTPAQLRREVERIEREISQTEQLLSDIAESKQVS